MSNTDQGHCPFFLISAVHHVNISMLIKPIKKLDNDSVVVVIGRHFPFKSYFVGIYTQLQKNPASFQFAPCSAIILVNI